MKDFTKIIYKAYTEHMGIELERAVTKYLEICDLLNDLYSFHNIGNGAKDWAGEDVASAINIVKSNKINIFNKGF